MSKFNPALWLNNRSRVFSDDSIDEPKAGVNFTSPTLDVGSGSNRDLMMGSNHLSPTSASLSLPSPSSAPSARLNFNVVESPKKLASNKAEEMFREWKQRNESRDNENPKEYQYPYQQQNRNTESSTSRSHMRHVSMPIIDHKQKFRDFDRAPPALDTQSEIYRSIGDNEDDALSHDNANSQIIGRNESFSSCISGLTADDTHYDDCRSVKSTDTSNQYRHRMHTLLESDNSDGDSFKPKGRDFGNAFDHLLYTDEAEREFGDDDHNSYRLNNRYASKKIYYNSKIQKPSHLRAQSDTMAYRPSTASSLSTHYNKQYLKPKLPAHATLREQIRTSGSILPKPQILQARSTSNTVQSNSTASSNNNTDLPKNGVIGTVWNGHPIDRFGNTLLSVPSVGTGSGSVSHNNNCSFDQSEELTTAASYSSGYQKHNELLGLRPRRPFHASNYSRTHDDFEERSLQDVPEDDVSTKWNDSKSIDAKSILSSSTTPSVQRNKRVVKDEIKFIVTRFVPARFRKISTNRTVTLERSEEGCLT